MPEKLQREGNRLEGPSIQLWGVGGHPVKNYGTYEIPFNLDDGKVQCSAQWEVSDVNKDVMAASKLIATGRYRSVMDSEGSYIERKIDGHKIPLELTGNTFWLPALVAPTDEGCCGGPRTLNRFGTNCECTRAWV